VYYDLSAALQYREYLSEDEAIKDQRAINPSAGATVEFSSGQTLSLSLADAYSRLKEPPYGDQMPAIVRDVNLASLQLRLAPNGGRFQIIGRYANALDIYEDPPYSLNNNMGNELVLDLSWRWLPKTALYAQVAQGMITYLDNASTQRDSYPLRAMGGLRGLITAKTAVNLGAGYTNGFYDGGATLSGWGNVAVAGEITYSVSALNQAGVGYRHDFRNSPQIGDFYSIDAVYGAFRQLIAGRVSTMLYGRYEHRSFRGGLAEGRVDQYVLAGVSADYFITDIVYVGALGSLNSNNTNRPSGTPGGGPEYTKFQVFGRLGMVY
jgi:hypothetical protein